MAPRFSAVRNRTRSSAVVRTHLRFICQDSPMPEDHFGETVAERYDELLADMSEPAVVDPVVDLLAELAGHGAALELGIGTGRIALPLARRGIRVYGIELSSAMLARLRAKPGAEQIDVTIGDFATTRVEGTFSLAYLVFNTINNLTTQDEQVACFQNVATHLERGGCDRGRRSGAPAAATRRDVPAVPCERDPSRDRRVRRREPGTRLTPLPGRRRNVREALDPVPLRLAVRARPDGTARRDDAAGALERLETRAVYEPQHQARLGLGEDLSLQKRACQG